MRSEDVLDCDKRDPRKQWWWKSTPHKAPALSFFGSFYSQMCWLWQLPTFQKCWNILTSCPVRPNELAWRIVANANENFRVLIERFVDLKWKYFEVRLGSNLALSVNRFVSVELIIIIIFSSLLFPLRSAIADQQQSIRCRWQNLRKCVYCLLHTYFDYFRFIWFVRS